MSATIKILSNSLFGLRSTDRPIPWWVTLIISLAYVAGGAIGTAKLYNWWNQPLLVDNQHYFYIAERAASGVPPHISNFDPKHHASSLLSAVGIDVGRLVDFNDVRSTRVVSLLLFGSSLAAIWLLVSTMTGSPLAGHVGAAALWSFSLLSYHASMGSRPKVFLIGLLLWSLYALAKRKPFLTGVLGAASYFCWQPGLLVLGAAAPVFLLGKNRWRSLMWLSLGSLLCVLVYEGYFARYGLTTIREQLFQTVTFPAEYMSHQTGGFPGFRPAFEKLKRTWNGSFPQSTIIAQTAAGAAALFWIVLLVLPFRVVRFLLREPIWIACGLCLYVSVAFTYYDHQGPPDLFFMLPFLAIAAAAAFASVMRGLLAASEWKHLRYVTLGVRVLGAAAGVALIALFLSRGFDGSKRWKSYRYTLDDQYALSARVAQMHAQGRTILAIRCTHLMGMARLENYTNYGFVFPGLQDYLTQRGTVPFNPVRDEKLPGIILEARLKPSSYVGKWLRANYQPLRDPSFARQGIRKWIPRR